MFSIRTKITLLTVCAMAVGVIIATVLGVLSVRDIGMKSSERLLSLMCETGEKNLDFYFNSVEQSVRMVSDFAQEDLQQTDREGLKEHVDRVRTLFAKAADRTNGVLTYYYRPDPAVTDTEKGFWFVNLDGNGFTEHEVTDITLYDTDDTSALVWFTYPKSVGKDIWLPPYVTDNLDVEVISYNVPVFWNGTFFGVVGIELDYAIMGEQVNSIKLYENGYAFINDETGRIVYHPVFDVAKLKTDEQPAVPDGLLDEGVTVRYTYNGVEKLASWRTLNNGMRLNVAVPVSEINGSWQRLIYEMLGVSVLLLACFGFMARRLTGHITKPLRDLTGAAEQVNEGNYDFKLDYDGNDEVGILTRTFRNLVQNLKEYIGDLNSLAYEDALTSVQNKGAYDLFVNELEKQVSESETVPAFAVAVFDCDDLKTVNDRYGHEKGDVYLKTASTYIKSVFMNSPVFRTGGDEFTVFLEKEDFRNRDELIERFLKIGSESVSEHDQSWEQVRVSIGVATYDPATDRTVRDAVRRADKLMYENKRRKKEETAQKN